MTTKQVEKSSGKYNVWTDLVIVWVVTLLIIAVFW